MKKFYLPLLVLTLALVLTLSGCKKKVEIEEPVITTPIPEQTDDVGEDEKDSIMKEFTNIVEGNNEPDKIMAYINQNIGKLSQLEGDIMIDSLERELEDHLQTSTDRILALDKDNELISIGGSEFYFPEDKVKDIKNKELKAEVLKSYENMYKLVNIEGAFYPIINYSKLMDYNKFISDEWKEYLAIRAMDSNSVPLVDEGLTITFEDLANRIIKTENYLNKYIDSQRQDEMLGLYGNKLKAYLKGVPNTPISDPKTKKIYDDVLSSYVSTSNMEGYVTQTIVYEYIQTIKANKNIINNKVLEVADKLIEEALEILSSYK